ncbi:DNA alkylation repair protein [Lactiplantibacillus plantarum]
MANLQTVILTNRDDDDSFIQKAIGWALRDYGKVNPEWGACFCHK